ncbi:MAG: GNAT family N-acetyltransferase [Acidimicrobiales bacterium]
MSPGLSSWDLENLGDRMVPGEQRTKMGDWILRADQGVTGRANSCWAQGPTESSYAAEIATVEGWYEQRSLAPRFQIYDGNEPLAAALLDRGYVARPGAIVMTAGDIGPLVTVEGKWSVSESVPAGLAELIGDAGRVIECTRCRGHVRVVSVAVDGLLVGGGVIAVDGVAAGIGLMYTHRAYRRMGVAASVLVRMSTEARALGARSFWLQVAPDNDGAIALYDRLGFMPEHRYQYYIAAPS